MFGFVKETPLFHSIVILARHSALVTTPIRSSIQEHLSNIIPKMTVNSFPQQKDALYYNALLDSHIETLQKEWNELYAKTQDILVKPLEFNSLYQLIKELQRLNQGYSANHASIYPKEISTLLQQFESQNRSSGDEEYQKIITRNDRILEAAKRAQEDYTLFIQKLLTGCCLSLSSYFILMGKLDLSVSENDTPEILRKKITDQKISTQIGVAFALKTPTPFLECLQAVRRIHAGKKENFLKFNEIFLMKNRKTIKHTDRYSQTLDFIGYFTLGLCGIDSDRWLHSETNRVTNNAWKDIPLYRYEKDLMEQFQLGNKYDDYFFGPDLWLSKQTNTNNAMVAQLIQNLKTLFLQKRAKGVKIGLGVYREDVGHVFAIQQAPGKETPDAPPYYLRDVNVGTLRFKNLDTLLERLPEYLKGLGHSADYCSYVTEYVPMGRPDYSIALEDYTLSKKILQRLDNSSISPKTPVLEFLNTAFKEQGNHKHDCNDEHGTLSSALSALLRFEACGEKHRNKILDRMVGKEVRYEESEELYENSEEYQKKIKELLPCEYDRLNVLRQLAQILETDNLETMKTLFISLPSVVDLDLLPETHERLKAISRDATDEVILSFCFAELPVILLCEARFSQFRIALFACRTIERSYAHYHENVKPLLLSFNGASKILNTIGDYCANATWPKEAIKATEVTNNSQTSPSRRYKHK